MTIAKKTATEFATELKNAIISRNDTYDTEVGPIADLVIQPVSNVLEPQNDRVIRVEQLLSLINSASMANIDVDNIIYNEDLIRLAGSKSTVTLIFSRATLPIANLTVNANFPVATLVDETTGTSVIFSTNVATTLIAASAASYFNATTQRYELQVTATSVISGTISNVASNRIIRPLRPLVGFDQVFNRDASTGGRDAEINDEAVQRYFISLKGTSPGIVGGIKKIIRDNRPDVTDSYVVFGSDPLMTRAAIDAGAVDTYLLGSTPTTITETVVFPGVGVTFPLVNQPVMSITSIDGGAYVAGIDYTLYKDISGNAGSVRAADGVSWLVASPVPPAVGDSLTVIYIYDAMPLSLQTFFADEKYNDPSRDLLFKEATQKDIAITATLTAKSGYISTDLITLVSNALLASINTYKLSQDIEQSDLNALVRSFNGVDNFVFTQLSLVGGAGVADIPIAHNEYARIDISDITITPA